MARKKSGRIHASGPAEALGHNPFAALGGNAPPASAPAEPPPHAEAEAPWRVGRTRKGGWPLSLERRGGNKSVTVLGNVAGDTDTLLKQLRKLCGAGGVVRDDCIELQGDHKEALAAWLEKHGAGR